MSIIHLITGAWSLKRSKGRTKKLEERFATSNISSLQSSCCTETRIHWKCSLTYKSWFFNTFLTILGVALSLFIGQAVSAQTVRTRLMPLLGQAQNTYQLEFPLQWPYKAVKPIILILGMMRYDLVTPVYAVYSTIVSKVVSPVTFALCKNSFYCINIFCPI